MGSTYGALLQVLAILVCSRLSTRCADAGGASRAMRAQKWVEIDLLHPAVPSPDRSLRPGKLSYHPSDSERA